MRPSPVRRCARSRRSCANVRVVLREFYVDDAGVPRAQAAQFLANGTGIAWVIEPYLALTTVDHRQFLPAYQPVTVASALDRSVMQYGITHSFPPAFENSDCDCRAPVNVQHWPTPNCRHRT